MAELSAACEGKAGTQFEHRLPDPSLETGSFGALVYLPAGYSASKSRRTERSPSPQAGDHRPHVNPDDDNGYRVLGISEDATADQIRAAFKSISRVWHPDKNENSDEPNRIMQRINEAKDRLLNLPSESEDGIG